MSSKKCPQNFWPSHLILFQLFVCQIIIIVVVGGQNVTHNNNNNNNNWPICIVGAGMSGLGLGRILQRRGRNVQLFDELDRVGGKVHTFRQGDDIQVEMGAIVFGLHQTSLTPYIIANHLTPVPFDSRDISGFDATTGQLFPLSVPKGPLEIGAMTSAVLRYLVHRQRYERSLRFGYVDASPDLFVSTADWLDAKGLGLLKPIFRIGLTMEGYGDLETTPALYTLKLVDRELLLANTIGVPRLLQVKEGLDVLVKRIGAPLKIHLNQRVIHITRVKKGHIVLTTVDTSSRNGSLGNQDKNCSKVILAFPPLLKNLERICPDLTREEKDVFAHVKIHKFTSAANSIPKLQKTFYVQAATTNDTADGGSTRTDPFALGVGEPVAFTRQNLKKSKNIYSSLSWIRGQFDEGPSDEDLKNIDRHLESTLQKLGNGSKTMYRYHSEYFPHVGMESLRKGFYNKFHAIQGRGGLYYATTLLVFEHMDGALKTAEGMVQKYSL